MQTVPITDGEMAYLDAGSGEPVVLLHGGGLTHRLWDPQVARLRDSFRCVAPDLRGHGGTVTRTPPTAYTVEQHARDVVALLDALQVASANVVGLSLGGLTGMQLALDAPDRVRSLVTLGAPAGFPHNVLTNMLIGMATRKTFRGLDGGGMRWFGEHAAERLTVLPEVKDYLREDAPRNDADEFRRVWNGIIAFDARPRLPQVTAPTMVIIGSNDKNKRGALTAAKLIPGSRLELIEGAGHITNRDAGARVDALLEEWLTSHALAPGR